MITFDISKSFHIFPLGKFISNPTSHKADLVSSLNRLFVHFAKGKKFGKDLYYNLVAKSLKSKLLAETWLRGKKIGPSCGTYSVEDVTAIKIGNKYIFKSSQDHSKFAISKAGSSNYYVCVGDINRMVWYYFLIIHLKIRINSMVSVIP